MNKLSKRILSFLMALLMLLSTAQSLLSIFTTLRALVMRRIISSIATLTTFHIAALLQRVLRIYIPRAAVYLVHTAHTHLIA